jgi:hypothetical protein
MHDSPADFAQVDEITKGRGRVEDMLQRAAIYDRIEALIETAGLSEI